LKIFKVEINYPYIVKESEYHERTEDDKGWYSFGTRKVNGSIAIKEVDASPVVQKIQKKQEEFLGRFKEFSDSLSWEERVVWINVTFFHK